MKECTCCSVSTVSLKGLHQFTLPLAKTLVLGHTQLQSLLYIYFFFCLFAIFWAAPAAHGGSQARGRIAAIANGLRQSHSSTGSEPRLRPTSQLTATPDRQPTEQDQALNPATSWFPVRFVNYCATTGTLCVFFVCPSLCFSPFKNFILPLFTIYLFFN